jgi:hypothetical protein
MLGTAAARCVNRELGWLGGQLGRVGSYRGRGFQREKDPIVLCQVGKFGKKRFETNK